MGGAHLQTQPAAAAKCGDFLAGPLSQDTLSLGERFWERSGFDGGDVIESCVLERQRTPSSLVAKTNVNANANAVIANDNSFAFAAAA